MLKVAFLGDAGVGKTSIIHAIISNAPTRKKSYRATLTQDFLCKEAPLDGQVVNLQIWDTAGQERYRALCPSFLRDLHACVLVYDVTNLDSLMNLQYWYDTFLTSAAPCCPDKLPLIVLGSKADTPDLERIVTPRRAKSFIDQNFGSPDEKPPRPVEHIEVSSWDYLNINDALMAILSMASHYASSRCLHGPHGGPRAPGPRANDIVLHRPPKARKRRCC